MIRRTIAYLVFSVIIILEVCGCMKQENLRLFQQEMLDYVNEKYQDEFTFEEPFGGAVGSKEKQMIVSSKKYEGERILVGCTLNDQGEAANFRDNLAAIHLRDELVQKLTDLTAEVYGEGRVFFRTPNALLPKEFDENTTPVSYTHLDVYKRQGLHRYGIYRRRKLG